MNYRNFLSSGRIILALAILFGAGLAIVLWHLSRLSSNLVETTAMEEAARHLKAVAEIRALYTSEVVERVRPEGVPVIHDYTKKKGAIPLPATFSMEIGRRISQ